MPLASDQELSSVVSCANKNGEVGDKKRVEVCQDDDHRRSVLAKHMGRNACVAVRERELGSHREWTDRGIEGIEVSTNTAGGVGSGVPRLEWDEEILAVKVGHVVVP